MIQPLQTSDECEQNAQEAQEAIRTESVPTHSQAKEDAPQDSQGYDDLNQSPVTSSLDKEFFGNDPALTPEISRQSKIVASWIRDDYPGGAIFGHKRTGRTFFCIYLQRTLTAMMGGSTMVIYWNTLGIHRYKDVEYLRDRLRQPGFDGFNQNRTSILIDRLKDQIRARAEETGARRIVFIYNEAQFTSETQMEFIGDLHNEFEQDFRIFCLLVGQNELELLANEYKSTEARSIASRYFQLTDRFHGIALSGLAETLNNLDAVAGSSVITRHFPSLAARGWKLGDAAPVIEAALTSMRDEMGIQHEMRLSMECIRAVANAILYRMETTRHNPLEALSQGYIRNYLRRHGFADILRRYQVEVPNAH